MDKNMNVNNGEILCNKKNIILVKKFDENEDDIYELYFNCDYDKNCNLFDILDNDGFENLFYELNKDIIFSGIRKHKTVLYTFKNIKKNIDDMVINLKISQLVKNENTVSFSYLNNDNKNVIFVEYMNYSFELKKDKLYVKLTAKFGDDSIIGYDIIMYMYKKCFYRLKSYFEL